MDPTVTEILNLIFRWVHVIAGVTWIGLLYYFNWINGPFVAQIDAETRQKALPELLPRVLYFFRWGAAYTWISGFLLLGIVYYMGGIMLDGQSPLSNRVLTGVGVGVLVVGFGLYDQLWKAMAKKELAGTVVSFVGVVALAFGLDLLMSGRAMYMHVGSLFGTCMAANVWMRIWPNQRKIIRAIKAGEPPPEDAGATAKLRSKHNTYMSIPLLFIMVSNHFPSTYGSHMGWVWLALIVAIGWGVTKFLYGKGASAAAAKY